MQATVSAIVVAVASAPGLVGCALDPSEPPEATGSSGAVEASSSESSGDVPRPNGEPCSHGEDCISGRCFVAWLASCSECETDDHCRWGCNWWGGNASAPWPGATCDDGTAGAACSTDAACDGGLRCGEVAAIAPPLPPMRTCGDCLDDGDCGDVELCTADFSPSGFGGRLRCVAPASLPLGATCSLGSSGDQACASGLCEEADLSGIIVFGVCSACSVTEDRGEPCADPTRICERPSVDEGEVTPGECV